MNHIQATLLAAIVFLIVGCGGGGSSDSGVQVRAWGVAERIETDADQAYSPQIAFDTAGNAIAVWRQFDGTRYNILANRYE